MPTTPAAPRPPDVVPRGVVPIPGGAPSPSALLDGLALLPSWTDRDLEQAGVAVRDVALATVGGGLGSLALIHVLRVAGVSPEDLAVVTTADDPAETYRYLAGNSQIAEGDRLRSDAGSVMDSIWGFPSYAWREAWAERSVRPLANVAVEPLLAEYFTPRAGHVYASVDREVARLGWGDMVHRGLARLVRRRAGGGWFVMVEPTEPGAPPVALRCRFVHLAVGYPGVRLLDDLQAFREQHPDQAHRVLNAYEPHEHAYAEARSRPTTVVVRGSGIVASRVIERLLDDVENQGADTRVVHLFRTYVDGAQGDRPWFRRPAGNGQAYQAFNFPKASWGGQLRGRLEATSGQDRAELLGRLGGTTTAPRRAWRRQIRRLERIGHYEARRGVVTDVRPGADARSVVTAITATGGGEPELVAADLVIDATGLRADPVEHPLLADLLATGGAVRNPGGRIEVRPTFEIDGTRNGDSRLYATGAMTLGGPYAGVDSFLGLQYCALAIADELATLGFAARIGPLRSTRQWWRWLRNRGPEGGPPHGNGRRRP